MGARRESAVADPPRSAPPVTDEPVRLRLPGWVFWGSAYVPAGEGVLYDARPHPLFIVLRSAGVLVFLLAAAGGLAWASGRPGSPVPASAARYVLWLAAARVGWNVLVWLGRRHIMTERRLVRVSGVIRRYETEATLERIQHVSVIRTLRERVFGLGTLGFATAGTAETEIYWVMIDRPLERLAMVRAALEKQSGPGEAREETGVGPGRAAEEEHAIPPGGAAPSGETRAGAGEGGEIPVIGIAGGIGAGKSEVARALGELGCVVIDSDREAKAALERPEVKAKLAEWWGPGVLRGDGTVDRGAVANVVFKDAAERERLEGLIHPLVRARREVLKRRAAEAGAPAVVVDAPLLYEAGVDRECDVVVFVDAPRALRLERVRAGRGWSEAELDRRERMQWPVEEKRRRADYVVVNDAGPGELMRRVREVFARIREGRGRGGAASGGRMG